MTTAHELREQFLEYFEKEQAHVRVASSPIVPPDDPTMLFTSAGMVQFKPLYAGTVDPLPYTRATTCQKCLRAGGKASDLENVGKTLRHHTFFEMLGNFSFGDYFKREALLWGWDFVWNRMKLPRERLWATIFEEDEETGDLLEADVGIPRSRIIPLDAKENFWGPAGNTGACGPCSEIIFFTGLDEEIEGISAQSTEQIARRIVDEGDLFLEIWNMVFPQFDQQPDGSRPPLKNRGIDTGAGLERMTTVMQFMETGGKVRSPYDTGLLSTIVHAAANEIGVPVDPTDTCEADRDPTRRYYLNAVADHARTLTFALSEGLTPSNEGRGYVLRRILRRALRFGYLMDVDRPFMYRLVEPVVDVMGEVYPEIKPQAEHVARLIRIEEERFLRTAAQGSTILDEKIAQTRRRGEKAIDGEDVFLLHATYGFPVDMTREIADDAGLAIDEEGYRAAMQRHQAEARQSWKGAEGGAEAEKLHDIYEQHGETEFLGYETENAAANVLALLVENNRVEAVEEGTDAVVVLDATPFYAESGGQVGDRGALESGPDACFEVCDTRKIASGVFLHTGRAAKGGLRVGDTVDARVDARRRLDIRRNHTVTHLLQAALKQLVGAHVTQSGSWVGPDALRFDFSHMEAVALEDLRRVEKAVNDYILADLPVRTEVLPIEEARRRGAIAPFGEKYGHVVRVITVGRDGEPPVSVEFCGGTHLDRTGRIGSFRLLSESSVAAGIRRIEGATGRGAFSRWAATRNVAEDACRLLAVKEDALLERVQGLQEEIKRLNREVKRAKQAKSSVSVDDLLHQAREIDGLQIVAARLEDADTDQMRTLADQLRDKAAHAVCVFGSTDGTKVQLVCAVTKDDTKRVRAGDVIKQVAAVVGGGGGGRPDFAQAGGKDPAKLDEAIAGVFDLVQGLIKD